MALYLNILTVVLLALVAGLLLVLHFQLREWRATARETPLLAEKLAELLMSARKGLADLKQELVALSPELNRLTGEGGKAKVELQFLLQKAEHMAERLERAAEDLTQDMPQARLAPAALATVEQVAVANGLAAKPAAAVPARTIAGDDPLEALLANLQGPELMDETVVTHPAKRKRSGPVTQAELDLQQSLKGAA